MRLIVPARKARICRAEKRKTPGRNVGSSAGEFAEIVRDPVKLMRVAIPMSIANRYSNHVTRRSLGRAVEKSFTNSFVNVIVSARIPVESVISCFARSLAKSNALRAVIDESTTIRSAEWKKTGTYPSLLPASRGGQCPFH